MKRRSFLRAVLGFGVAGAVAPLLPKREPESVWSAMLRDPRWERFDPIAKYDAVLAKAKKLTLYADGEHCDADALERWFEGKYVSWPNGEPVGDVLTSHRFALDRPIEPVSTGSAPRVFVGNLLRHRYL